MPQSHNNKDSRINDEYDDEDDKSVISNSTINSSSTKTPSVKSHPIGRVDSRDKIAEYYQEQSAKLNNVADSPDTIAPATPVAPQSALRRAMFAVSSLGSQAVTPTFSQRTMDIVNLGRKTGAKISDIMNQIEDVDSKVLRRGESKYFKELLGDVDYHGVDETSGLADTPCKYMCICLMVDA